MTLEQSPEAPRTAVALKNHERANGFNLFESILDPEAGLQALRTTLLLFFFLLSDFPFSKDLSFLNRSL